MRNPPLSHHYRAGSLVNKPEKLVFGRLDPLRQVMVERSREKHSLHRISRMIVLYGLCSLSAIRSARIL